ncbi:MAG: (2Fe-2S)-binding protein [Chloroflexi bacterium]|nr:(2Fe-2S)-binding protein [Chloroflexota bacterium]
MVFDGQPVPVRLGQSVAAALWASGVRATRVTNRRQMPRGSYCGDGSCYECLVVVDGVGNLRACETAARPGLRVETQIGFGPL